MQSSAYGWLNEGVEMKTSPVVIVGAGLCGLTLAAKLSARSVETLVIEKSQGLGGRVATRRDGEAVYDHGAAFYTDSDAEPNIWHKRWSESGKAKIWFTADQQRYVCGSTGMTGFAKDLAQGLNVNLNEKVVQIGNSPKGITLFCESGEIFRAQKIILTCPLPQSLEILNSSFIFYQDSLDKIKYSSALVGLFELENKSSFFNFNLLKPNTNIYTIANNQSKGISQKLALSVVMSESWSGQHYQADDSRILQAIENELRQYFKTDLRVLKAQLKKWRYSQPTSVYQEKYVSLNNGQILLAGDAFGGGSIAGAIRSANAVFEHLIELKVNEVNR